MGATGPLLRFAQSGSPTTPPARDVLLRDEWLGGCDIHTREMSAITDLFEFADGKISRKDSFWKIVE